jgi:hypothetical protein
LKIRENIQNGINMGMARSYNNIGEVYLETGEIKHFEEFKMLLPNRVNRVLGLAILFKGGGKTLTQG